MNAAPVPTVDSREPAAARRPAPRFAAALIVLVACMAGGVAFAAARHTSTTFDEIVFMTAGARGFATGDFDLAPDHPPLPQYVYGLPVYLAGPAYPDETGVTPAVVDDPGYRYLYAQQMLFGGANDPERLAMLGRIPAALCVALLVLAAGFLTARHFGAGAGVLAALLTGALPDVLAHGGVAYNDLPLALFFLLSVFALDRAVRVPSPIRGALAGAAVGGALAFKASAIVLAPVAAVLILLEGAGRWRESDWRRGLALAVGAGVLAIYLVLVAVYRFDPLLTELRFALASKISHASQGHAAYAFLLGERQLGGWWYFFPVAFLFKTSAALHLLLLLAVLHHARRRSSWRDALRSPLRAPVAGLLVFAAVLVASDLNIGFRYALPLLPLLVIVIAAGCAQLWRSSSRLVRATIAVATIWAVAAPLTYYPHVLAYISEYGPGRDRGHEVLIDSSLDWGQGLLALRDYMESNEIPSVYLSYFGSARPEGYGIAYVPLPSFFPLARSATPVAEPRHVVISATNLMGSYFANDPYADFREREPTAVLGHTLFVYRIE